MVFPTDMSEYAVPQFDQYLQEKDPKEKILMENSVPSNVDDRSVLWIQLLERLEENTEPIGPLSKLFYVLENAASDKIKEGPADIYLFKVNNGRTRTLCEICSKLTLKTPEQIQCCRSGVFIVNFEQISHIILFFLLLPLNK